VKSGRGPGVAGVLLLALLAGCAARETPLPDWGGTWGAGRQSLVDSTAALQSALKPAGRADYAAYRDKALADDVNIKQTYCRPLTFGGFSGGFRGNIEFLFTPGRVTVISEAGLVRRIYTDGRALPANPEPTDGGTSVAHWDGQALVVETIGLSPDAYAFNVPGTRLGDKARVTERMALKDADTLQVDTTLEAPELLNQAVKVIYQYARARDVAMTSYSPCPEYDRSVDPATGHQRFDMTPPAGLPPPPAQ
jgi:hypothetical protein